MKSMKMRTLIKTAVISSVVLMCTGFVMYSFFRLSAAENRNDFNLYSLVPPSTTAVLETDDLTGLIQDVNQLSCSKDQHFLYFSHLFSLLKQHLHTLLEDTPHGLSRQMSKVLLSFHEPDNDRNQVLYCRLGTGDYELVEKFITKYCSSAFPSKMFNYKGEDIRIYPMPDGDFLACYITSRYLVVSYQKRLIEEVIEARLSGRSLLAEPDFKAVHTDKKTHIAASIYARMQPLGQVDRVAVAASTDDSAADAAAAGAGLTVAPSAGGWTELEMTMKDNSLYFSGISHDADSCSFINVLRRQESVQGLPKDVLPATTFFFSKRSVSDLRALYTYTAGQTYAAANYPESTKLCDDELFRYLYENAGQELLTCLFQPADSTAAPAAVMSLSLLDPLGAEGRLKRLIASAPQEEREGILSHPTFCRTSRGAYLFYVLPRSTLFAQFAGVTSTDLRLYACFYAGRLLLAPDGESLSAYVNLLDKRQLLDGNPVYEAGVSALSNSYQLMLVADMESVLSQPNTYARLLPGFFFRNSSFFQHFVLFTQFTCVEGVVYPNVVLLYKG